jgi:hypothetical protein
MAITPDTKDWTWVLQRPCPECGFESASIDRSDVAPLTREVSSAWQEVLGSRSALDERPTDEVWSPLEYACHVRDVFRIYDERLQLMIDQDDPTFPNWDQDTTAIEDDYRSQDPTRVAEELTAAGERLAAGFEGLTDQQWTRTGLRSDGAHFDVDSFARYFIHDPVHHLHDVGASFTRPTG